MWTNSTNASSPSFYLGRSDYCWGTIVSRWEHFYYSFTYYNSHVTSATYRTLYGFYNVLKFEQITSIKMLTKMFFFRLIKKPSLSLLGKLEKLFPTMSVVSLRWIYVQTISNRSFLTYHLLVQPLNAVKCIIFVSIFPSYTSHPS